MQIASGASGAPASRWSSKRVLKTRIISALIMAPLVISGVLFLDNPPFAAILGVVLLAGVWEWSHLVPLQSLAARGLYTAGLAVLMVVSW